MLILTRNIQETIMIGDDVTITVLSIQGNQVKLGIDAPHDVAVHREEIYHRIHNANIDEPRKKQPEKNSPPTYPQSYPQSYNQPSEMTERPKKQPIILQKKRKVLKKD